MKTMFPKTGTKSSLRHRIFCSCNQESLIPASIQGHSYIHWWPKHVLLVAHAKGLGDPSHVAVLLQHLRALYILLVVAICSATLVSGEDASDVAFQVFLSYPPLRGKPRLHKKHPCLQTLQDLLFQQWELLEASQCLLVPLEEPQAQVVLLKHCYVDDLQSWKAIPPSTLCSYRNTRCSFFSTECFACSTRCSRAFRPSRCATSDLHHSNVLGKSVLGSDSNMWDNAKKQIQRKQTWLNPPASHACQL